MKWLYITRQNDTWDLLAHDIYGSEKLMHVLIAENPSYAETIIFTQGVQLIISETPVNMMKTNTIKAPWDEH